MPATPNRTGSVSVYHAARHLYHREGFSTRCTPVSSTAVLRAGRVRGVLKSDAADYRDLASFTVASHTASGVPNQRLRRSNQQERRRRHQEPVAPQASVSYDFDMHRSPTNLADERVEGEMFACFGNGKREQHQGVSDKRSVRPARPSGASTAIHLNSIHRPQARLVKSCSRLALRNTSNGGCQFPLELEITWRCRELLTRRRLPISCFFNGRRRRKTTGSDEYAEYLVLPGR